jgi:transcriptional regulator with GAF, ATPase, and Fis domain
MTSNTLAESQDLAVTGTAPVPVPDPGNIIGFQKSEPTIETGDDQRSDVAQYRQFSIFLKELASSLAECPASEVSRQLEELLDHVCVVIKPRCDSVTRNKLVQRLKLVTEVLAAGVARNSLDEQTGRVRHDLLQLKTVLEEHLAARKNAEEALMNSNAEIEHLKERLRLANDYLKAELQTAKSHNEIIGRSSGIKRVLLQVEQVAPADCPVLITGETGTGKELIAREIHGLSARKERTMVLVNCAALPSALVESELFGRERGAYTGALTSQVGRFEVADRSTIFLDEVGELPMEAQAKLLRVLQHGEFERLGSPTTRKANVRIIAATNRDLAEEVRKGKFREDLYYRLKVFPIVIPPLRERTVDIPLMVFAFMEEFSSRMGKKISKIPRNAMEALQRHPWPGNIRELRNVIEHSIILSSGDMLKLSMISDAPVRGPQPVTLAEAEREHILKTLEATNWRIKGTHGAAERLAMQPSTLYSRMLKLGVPNRRQREEQERKPLFA